MRSHGGDVEVLNNANGICVGNIKFGTWKWGKLSYRSGFGFEVSRDENHYPLDAALTAQFSDGAIHGRHQCQPIAVEADHCASVYGLGDRFSQNHVSVETRLWWKAGWQLHWHHVTAHRPAVLRLGTYSLPLPDATARELKVEDDFGLARSAERGVAIQPLRGFHCIKVHESDPERRTHLLAWHSLSPRRRNGDRGRRTGPAGAGLGGPLRDGIPALGSRDEHRRPPASAPSRPGGLAHRIRRSAVSCWRRKI